MRNFVYAYHAMFQPGPGTTTHLDGVLNLDTKITSHTGITAAKALIAESYCPPEKLTLCNITLLHEEDDGY